MQKLILSFLILVFMVSLVDDASAQRRGSKKRRTEDTSRSDDRRDEDYSSSTFMDNLNIEIKPGNLFVGNVTNLSLKSNVGYKFNNTFSAGVGGKILYYWDSFNGGFTDYGGLGYVRAKVSKEIYFVGEYNIISVAGNPRSSISYPGAGIGYMRPGIDWSSGFELLFIFSEEARQNLQLPLEYWINFSHNF